MVGLELIGRLRRRQEFSSYSKQLAGLLSGDALLRSMPRLRSVPLAMRSAERQAIVPADVRAGGSRLLARAEPLVGGLLVAQVAHDWLQEREHPAPAPLPLDLAALDDGVGSPHALLTGFLTGVGAIHAGDAQHWALLIAGLAALSEERRALWQRMLIVEALPSTVQLALVVAPPDAGDWPGFVTADVALDRPKLAHWLPDGMAALTEVAARDGAYIVLQELLLAGQPKAGDALARERAALALVESHGGRPSDLLGLGLQSYLDRRRRLIASAQQAAPAQLIDHPDRDELLPLVAAAGGGDTVIRGLWSRRADPSALLLAARCLAASPAADPLLALLIVGAIARGAGDDPHVARLCAACLPALDRALDTLRARSAGRLVSRTLAALPADAGVPRLAALAYAADVSDSIGWACVAQLVRAGARDSHPAPEAGAGLARWVVVRAAGGPSEIRAIGGVPQPVLVQTIAGLRPDRRRAVASAVVAEPQVGALARLSVLEMLVTGGVAPALIEMLARDTLRELRLAAHMLLLRDDPGRALRCANQIVADRTLPWEVRRDALPTMRERRSTAFLRTLSASVGDGGLPLHVRVEALRALAVQPNARVYLMRAAREPNHPALRAAALQLLQSCLPRMRERPIQASWLIAQLRALLGQADLPSPVAERACALLGVWGGPLAAQLLCDVVERAAADPARTEAAVHALGAIGDPAAAPALERLLGPDGLARLRGACPPELLRAPSGEAADSPLLAPPMARALRAAVDICLTSGERPTTLSEYLIAAAEGLRRDAAQALTQIGGAAARQALSAGIRAGGNGMATPAMVAALAQLCGPADTATMRAVLLDPRVDERTRWLVAQGVAEHAAALGALLEGIESEAIDPFTKGEIAEALGRRRHPGAAQLLADLALSARADRYLRERALVGLGLHGDPHARQALLTMACDTGEPAELRGLAAAQLGGLALAPTELQALRNLLRGERATPVQAGIIQALGRARDREALPLLLQHALDERPDVARAAIDALAQIGDQTVTPNLIRLTQRAGADRMLRLHTIGALLQIGDREYAPLLRDYLQDGALPVQLQALELLVQSGAAPRDLLGLACERGRAIPFRLRALQAAAGIGGAALLAQLLADLETPAPLRGQVASMLAQIGGSPAESALVAAALRGDDLVAVRLACVAALAQRADPATAPAIAELIAQSAGEPTLHAQACQALITIMMQ